MEKLPDDIVLYNILPWLPTKTLLRFRCVCKSWDSFIRHPSFLHLRKLTNNTTHHFLVLSPHPQASASASAVGTSQPHLFSTPFRPDSNIATTPPRASFLFALPNLKLSETRVQCVNGLLCFHPKCYVWFSSHVNAFTLVANPTTRQGLTLPLDHSIDQRFMVSTHFGYDPVRDQFKVLRWIKYEGSHEFKVFTLGGDVSWRVVTPETPFALTHRDLLSRLNKTGLCVNGAIHWTCSTDLLIFDVGTEQFRVMPGPSGSVGRLMLPDLVEIDGCLCLVGYVHCGRSCDLKLWILRDYQAQLWEQKTVVLSSLFVFFLLCRVPTGEILLLQYHQVRPDRGVSGVYYDMDTMSSRSAVIMDMLLTWTKTLGKDVIVFCQESFRLLK